MKPTKPPTTPTPPSIQNVILSHDRWITATVGAFTSHLTKLLSTAQADVIAQLHSKLVFAPDGTILPTPANQRVLRSIDTLFSQAMDKAGYQSLVNNYTQQFGGNFHFFDEIVNAIDQHSTYELPDTKTLFTSDDKKALTALQTNSTENLSGLVDQVALLARQSSLISIGGLRFKDLTNLLSERFDLTLSRAQSLADTSITSFYRALSATGFEEIEKDLPEQQQRYKYAGPYDKLNRPFCRHLLNTAKTYTRAEIDELDNGQIPNVMITCGGWRCRHQWLLAIY